MANTSKQQILTLHTTQGEQYNAATEQQDNIVGQRLAWARNQAGISLAKFSTLLEEYGVNVGAGAIHKWELGRSVPSAYQLIAVAKALKLEDNLSQFISDYVPDLNEEGMRKVATYKADLIATGKYKPMQKASNFFFKLGCLGFFDIELHELFVYFGD